MEKPLNHKNPFKVPENYFESLEEELLKKREMQKTKSHLSYTPLAAAASFVLLMGLSWFTLQPKHENSIALSSQELLWLEEELAIEFEHEELYTLRDESDTLSAEMNFLIDDDKTTWQDVAAIL